MLITAIVFFVMICLYRLLLLNPASSVGVNVITSTFPEVYTISTVLRLIFVTLIFLY